MGSSALRQMSGNCSLISQVLLPSARSSPSVHHLSHTRSCGASKSRPFSSSSSGSFTKSASTSESFKKNPQESASAATSPSSPPTPSSSSASSFLRAQAALEEVDTDPRPKKTIPELREEAWDGDEPQERALRRILEDSYKPLRVKGFVKKIPVPAPLPNRLFDNIPRSTPSAENLDDSESLIGTASNSPSSETPSAPATPKNPWDFTFKAPDSYRPVSRSNIYLAQAHLRAPSTSKSNVITPRRLADAVERSRDYESGYGQVQIPAEEQGGKGRTGMGSMRSWDGLIEEKIKTAQREGLFKNVKGRGKPMRRDDAESNPYIARDEFLMNRIMKNQGAAPPWIELQGELDIAQGVFRSELRSTWTRRATRMLSLGGVTRSGIKAIENGWRDKEWEDRERAFHEVSIKSLNGIMQRYNGVAPYPVRRAPLRLVNELEQCFKHCATPIADELRKRLSGAPEKLPITPEKVDRKITGKVEEEIKDVDDESMWSALRRVVTDVFGEKKK